MSLEQLLEKVPRAYVSNVLARLAPRLLAGINCVSLPPSESQNVDALPPPTHICTYDPSKVSQHSPFPPDCFLAFTFPPSPSSPTRLLVPAHSIFYALECPRLAPSLSLVDSQTEISQPIPRDQLRLPVHGPFELPSYDAFVTFHSYLHDKSPSRLLQSLLVPSQPFSLPPSPPPSPDSSPQPRIRSLPGVVSKGTKNEQHVKRIEEMRRTAETLGYVDEAFWETLARAEMIVADRQAARR
ncbi:uncharacterized protein JCM6883_000584 [Sporobolomyces salmoneus]|uniref:uncharacterized protein n=1 Tax=Sporobolomyces salmoneus TaxID=183962 RepID=UPI0031789F32